MFYFKAVDFFWKIQKLNQMIMMMMMMILVHHQHEFLKPYLGFNFSGENISKRHSQAVQAKSVWL